MSSSRSRRRDPRTGVRWSRRSPGGKPLTVTAPDARTVVVSSAAVRAGHPDPRSRGDHAEAQAPGSDGGGHAQGRAGPDAPPSDMASIGPFVMAHRPAEPHGLRAEPELLAARRGWHPVVSADRLTIEIVPDQDAELVRLQSGQIDFTQQPFAPWTSRRCAARRSAQGADPRTRRQPRGRLAPVQPPSGPMGKGSARRLDHAEGVPSSGLTRRQSRRVRQHRIPGRSGARLRSGHTGQ